MITLKLQRGGGKGEEAAGSIVVGRLIKVRQDYGLFMAMNKAS